MSDHDAHKALEAAARAHGLRILDPLELTQRMPVADRRYRQAEGHMMYESARGEGHARAMVNNPVYRAQEMNAGLRQPDFRDGQPTQDYPTRAARRGWTDE